MIDLHSHILPGFDDGSKSLDESIAMLKIAAAAGTTDIVASPHANPDFPYQAEAVDRAVADLQRASGPAPRIHRGCDFHLSYDNIQDALANPDRYTINHKNYLLVEFSDLLIAKSIDEVFRRMRQSGIIPVITHPERNALLQRRRGQLQAWVETGCALQVTAQSFFGRFGTEARDSARELMKRNLVHFIASDAHDCEDRPPKLDEAHAYVAKKYGEARAERLFVLNPEAALYGERIELTSIPEPPRRKWYQFW
ncbi:MAG: exopolysaccharide biosynthesis protein [Acidobacteria bacterium]|nr:exopolysaccharide biosynthesis protein [Acidobacteriota bacterium]